MTIDRSDQARLAFLLRVIQKEIIHLEYAATQVFDQPFTAERAQTLEEDKGLALKVEAFSSRFCRLQDTLGDKLLPAWLSAMGEAAAALLTNLDKAEKFGWLESADTWVMLRQLRNQMVHEYIENPQLLSDALQTAHAHLGFVKAFAATLSKTIQSSLIKPSRTN
jgi:hypothetical protein